MKRKTKPANKRRKQYKAYEDARKERNKRKRIRSHDRS